MLDSTFPGPGRWGDIPEFEMQYMDLLHVIAAAELAKNKTLLNFWRKSQPIHSLIPRAPIVEQVSAEVRKIAYQEGWMGVAAYTDPIAWRICHDWGFRRAFYSLGLKP